MKIMVCEAPKKLSVAEIPDIPLGKNQIRAKTLCSAISHGTEMSFYKGTSPFFARKKDDKTGIFIDAGENEKWTYPVRTCDPGVWYMGYSAVGEITEVGEDVKTLKIGDMIYASAPHQSQIICDENSALLIPSGINPENAVVLTNLQTTYNGILDTSIKLGDTVVVSGLGVLGQLLVQMVKMSGATTVIGVDTLQKRLDTALENGADYAFNPLTQDAAVEVRKLTDNKGADAVIEVSGNQSALQNAIRMAGNDTVITALSWYQGSCSALDMSEEFHHNRVTIKCSQTGAINPSIRHMWDNERKTKMCVKLLEKLNIQNLITHRFKYEDVASAYELIDSNPQEIIQVVITY